MRTPVRKETAVILLVEEHPVRSRLYTDSIQKAGYTVVRARIGSFTNIPQPYDVALVSISEDTTHGPYKFLFDTLPSHVPCVVLTAGPLPLFLSGHAQLVGHINRTETHPNDLLQILKTIVAP